MNNKSVTGLKSKHQKSSKTWTDLEIHQLIDSVKTNPALYNLKDKRYKCYSFTQNTWNNIDLLLKKSPGESQEKWSKLRLTFRKEYLRSSKKHESNRKEWKFYNEMLFISPHLYTKGPSLQECLVKITTNKENFCEENNSNIENNQQQSNFTTTFENISQVRNNEIAQLESYESLQRNDTPSFIDHQYLSVLNDSNNTLSQDIQQKTITYQNRLCDFEGSADIFQVGSVKIKKIRISDGSPSFKNLKTITRQDSLKISSLHSKSPRKLLSYRHPKINQSEIVGEKIEPHKLCTCSVDDDILFLQNIHSSMKYLSKENKFKFKLQVHALLKENF